MAGSLFPQSVRSWIRIDPWVIALALGLAACGILTLWGAAAPEGRIGPLRGFARTQLQWAIVGTIAMLVVWAVDYRWAQTFAWPIFAAVLIALVGVLLLNRRIHGSASWFVVEAGGRRFQFQPAELAKISIVILLARYLSLRAGKWGRLVDTFAPLALAAVPVGLILLQPDFGTAVVFLPVVFAMFFVAGIRKRVILIYFLLGVGAAAAAYPQLKPYQKDRLFTFMNPGEDALGKGYNVIQAQTALGSGGVFGKGWGRGTQTSFRFLPEYQTDFVFPSLGEQFGLFGCLVALGLYALLLARMAYVAGRAEMFGRLVLAGFAAILTVHIMFNIGMVTGFLPVTGLPLPFISYGGSFMLSCFLMMGMTLSIAARKED